MEPGPQQNGKILLKHMEGGCQLTDNLPKSVILETADIEVCMTVMMMVVLRLKPACLPLRG